MNVAPGTSFEASTDAFAAAATVGVRIRDGQGADTLARTTVGVTLDVTVGTKGVFRRTFTAISLAGQYLIVWDDGSNVDSEELLVTGDAASVGGTSNLYISAEELKAGLRAQGTTFLDDDCDEAVAAASRAIDGYKKTKYYPVSEARVYSPDRFDTEIVIDDLAELTSVTLDFDGDGTYEITWTQGTDFDLAPANAATDGKPYNRLILRRPRPISQTFDIPGGRFPFYRNGVKVTGLFGWAETPIQVKKAARILATRYIKRGDTPFGILTIAGPDMIATARLGRMDQDVAALLASVDDPYPDLVSVRLG